MAIKLQAKGNYDRTFKFLKFASKFEIRWILNKYGDAGVKALASATPIDSGETASSWRYEIESGDTGYKIVWLNDNVNNGVNIAVILQYGHGTGTGGYVQGRDYINPALQPIFDNLADEAWREVTRQ